MVGQLAVSCLCLDETFSLNNNLLCYNFQSIDFSKVIENSHLTV